MATRPPTENASRSMCDGSRLTSSRTRRSRIRLRVLTTSRLRAGRSTSSFPVRCWSTFQNRGCGCKRLHGSQSLVASWQRLCQSAGRTTRPRSTVGACIPKGCGLCTRRLAWRRFWLSGVRSKRPHRAGLSLDDPCTPNERLSSGTRDSVARSRSRSSVPSTPLRSEKAGIVTLVESIDLQTSLSECAYTASRCARRREYSGVALRRLAPTKSVQRLAGSFTGQLDGFSCRGLNGARSVRSIPAAITGTASQPHTTEGDRIHREEDGNVLP